MLANRLSTELRQSFLYLKQFWEQDVSQVLLCGDMPEVRSLTAPLIERLNIEVETLDTLEGIDAHTFPKALPNARRRFVWLRRLRSSRRPSICCPRSDGEWNEPVGPAPRCSRHRGGGRVRCVSLHPGVLTAAP